MTPEILRFLVAGGIAAAVNWGSRFVFSLALPYEVAVACAFPFGLATGFLLMRGWVFNAAGQPLGRQVLTYVAVNLFALAQTVGFSSLFARVVLPALGIQTYTEAIGHAVGVFIPAVTSFVGHKWGTFRRVSTEES